MNQLQKAGMRRKVIYVAVILGLFTISMFWRGTLDIPLRNSVAAANTIATKTILYQAQGLELREVDEGEQELEGSTRRLLVSIMGGRGVAVTILWRQAIEKQKRNDFHEMESLIRKVTQLQPHFITPWIFQSWNIAYNVSVEMQGSGDMYFYIARGIELLAEGERRQGRPDPDNPARRIGSPDMRWQLGFYYQNKFGVSDTVEVLRCLYQLSCIPPNEWNPDPGGLTKADGSVDLEKFQAFCENHPHLIRRLRGENPDIKGGDENAKRRAAEALKNQTPESIIQFFRDNREIPTRFKNAFDLQDADKQFPALPPKFAEGEEEAHPGMTTGGREQDGFSAFQAARAWFLYAAVPVPPNARDDFGKPLPLMTPRPGKADPHKYPAEYDPVKYRVPRQPMLIIFLQAGPRSQTYQGEMEQKEGWYDDGGWQIDDPKKEARSWWFPNESGRAPKDVVVGRNKKWSEDAWSKAAVMWEKHGAEYGQILTSEQIKRFEDASQSRPPEVAGEPTPDQLDDQRIRQWWQGESAMRYYRLNRQVTNFPFFYASAQGEQQPGTIDARKTLWQAEQKRKLGDFAEAIKEYRKGLDMWKAVLQKNKDFHRPERSDRIDEETYGYDLAYQRLLVLDDPEVRKKAEDFTKQVELAMSVLPGPLAGNWSDARLLPPLEAAMSVLPYPLGSCWTQARRLSPLSVTGAREIQEEIRWYIAENSSPFAGVIVSNDDRNNTPWIPNRIKESVKQQQGIVRKPLVNPDPGAAPPPAP